MVGTWTSSEDEDFGSVGDLEVRVTGGTSGAPAGFVDFVTADRAGEAVLLAATAGGAALTLDQQVRPVEDGALQVSLIVASKTTETDYVFITGTDAVGGAQTESVDVSAGNGTYVTTKFFKTITNLDCSDNPSGGGTVWADGTLRVTQARWGLIWDLGDDQYRVDADLLVGDASTSTYFASEREQISFDDDRLFTITNSATLRSGDLLSGESVGGSSWNHHIVSANFDIIASGSSSATFLAYGSTFQDRTITGTVRQIRCLNGTVTIRHCRFSGWPGATQNKPRWHFKPDTAFSIDYSYFESLDRLSIKTEPSSFVGNGCHNTTIQVNDVNITMEAPRLTGTTTQIQHFDPLGVTTTTIIDAEGLITTVVHNHNGNIIEQVFTVNVHIVDIAGTPLSGVGVKANYANLVEGTDGKTYKCIADHTAIDATHRPITGSSYASFWELYNSAGGDGGDWVTGFAYKADEPEFTVVTTDGNGDIAEQQVRRLLWRTTAEQKESRIHEFTISKGGYTIYTFENVLVAAAINWHVEMQPLPAVDSRGLYEVSRGIYHTERW